MDHHSGTFHYSVPSDGARLNFEQVADGGANRVEQEVFHPTIYRAASSVEIANMGLSVSQDTTNLDPSNISNIFLVRRENAQQAYALTHAPEQAIDLRKPGRPANWGSLFYAKVYPTEEHHPNIFRVPPVSQRLKEVVIKRLNKKAINSYLRMNGGGENPYKELARMEELGDNIHVLQHEEALEDDTYLYIVLPKGIQTLRDTINWHERYSHENAVNELMTPERCHEYFCKIVQILSYLETHGVNHHDISPDNLLFLSENNLVLFDFALSDRIPINPATRKRTLILPSRIVYGKFSWMDSMVYRGTEQYDGVAMDMYAAGLMLYSMSTNEVLYVRPDPNLDLDYRHFIYFQGLWSGNERINDHLRAYGQQMQGNPQARTFLQRLMKLTMLHFELSEQVLHLLENMLHEDPKKRYTLAEVMESEYVNQYVSDMFD